MANILMVLSWAVFYFLHTSLAATKLKRILKAKWPGTYNWYRLFYSLLSILLFIVIAIQALFLPVERLFKTSPFGQYAGYLIAAAGVMISLKSIREISVRSFLGFKTQAFQEVEDELITSGMYSQVRHPLYLGLVAVFLGYFLVSGTLGALIHLACLAVYLPIGIYYEEKNLREIFDVDYKNYQREVPAFFPRIYKKRG